MTVNASRVQTSVKLAPIQLIALLARAESCSTTENALKNVQMDTFRIRQHIASRVITRVKLASVRTKPNVKLALRILNLSITNARVNVPMQLTTTTISKSVACATAVVVCGA